MALRVSIHGYAETHGRISRREIVRFVTDYCQRHEPLRRSRHIVITFLPELVDVESGTMLGGGQTDNFIDVVTRATKGRRILNEDEIIMVLAHELYHRLMQKTRGRRAAKTMCKGYVHTPDERPEELAAEQHSLHELARWQSLRLISYAAQEMHVASKLSPKWADEMATKY